MDTAQLAQEFQTTGTAPVCIPQETRISTVGRIEEVPFQPNGVYTSGARASDAGREVTNEDEGDVR